MQIDDQQWDVIRKHFPEETPIPDKPGPKLTPAREILEAVLWILNTGAQWAELPQKFPPYQTVHKWFQAWCRDDTLCDILCDLANQLRERGVIDERESFIDVMFSPAKGGGEGVENQAR